MTRFLLILFVLLPVMGTVTARAETVFIKPDEALKAVFKDSKEVIMEKKSLTDEQAAALSKQLGGKIPRTGWNFYIARTEGKIDGYAVIDNEVGKTEPITFMTAITPEGDVKEVEVLVFREPFGGEVHEARFLKQYRGRKITDPIRIGQDISNISGATMSARAVSAGVKRDLAVWKVIYGR